MDSTEEIAIVLQKQLQLTKMTRILLLSASTSMLVAFSLSGCHKKSSLTPQQVEGKQLYDVRCAHCHENNDLQLKKVPPNLHGLFNSPRLPSGAPATDVQVARTVLGGRNMMPPFAGRFTTEEMKDLLSYLHTGMKDDDAQ